MRTFGALQNLTDFWNSLESKEYELQARLFASWRPPASLTRHIFLARAVGFEEDDDIDGTSELRRFSMEQWRAFVPNISVIDFPLSHVGIIRNDQVFQLLQKVINQCGGLK